MELPSVLDIPLSNLSAIGLVGSAIIANVFPAIPEEIFLLSFGYLSNAKPETFPFFKIIFFLIIGFLIIDSIVYYLALKGNKIIKFLVNKVLDIEIHKEEEFLKKNANKIIFLSRFLVQLRVIGPVTAATIRYPVKKFLFIDLLALLVYVPMVMGIGYYFHNSIENILSGANVIRNIMVTFLVLLVFIIIIRKFKKGLLKTIK